MNQHDIIPTLFQLHRLLYLNVPELGTPTFLRWRLSTKNELEELLGPLAKCYVGVWQNTYELHT